MSYINSSINMKKKNKLKYFVFFLLIVFISIFFLSNISINEIFGNSILKGEELLLDDEDVMKDKDVKTTEIVQSNIPKEDTFEEEVRRYTGKTPENILLIGVDIPDTNDIKEGANGSTGIRTDTIMLVNVDRLNDKITVTSIPRDSRVKVKGKLDKINHAHSYGGIDLLVDTIQENFDVEIDRYVRVDYQAVESITKDIGGVDVEVKEPMHYVDPTEDLGIDINFEPGFYNLQGRDALRFLRYRSSEGDLYRIRNQQYFLQQMGDKMFDLGILKLSKIIMENSLKYVDTNMSTNDILGMLKISTRIDMNDIIFDTLPGYGKYISGKSYFIINEDKLDLEIYKK